MSTFRAACSCMALFAWLLSSSEALAQRLNIQVAQQLTVFDATGKRIGNVLAPSPFAQTVAVTVEGRLMLLNVRSYEIAGQSGTLMFATSDCSGTAFNGNGPLGETPDFMVGEVASFKNKIYVPDGPAQSVHFGSWLQPDEGTCLPGDFGDGFSQPLRLFVDFNQIYRPPYTVK